MEYYDRVAIDTIARKVSLDRKGLQDLIVEVVASPPFTLVGKRTKSLPDK
jgi:hypothetical protein